MDMRPPTHSTHAPNLFGPRMLHPPLMMAVIPDIGTDIPSTPEWGLESTIAHALA